MYADGWKIYPTPEPAFFIAFFMWTLKHYVNYTSHINLDNTYTNEIKNYNSIST